MYKGVGSPSHPQRFPQLIPVQAADKCGANPGQDSSRTRGVEIRESEYSVLCGMRCSSLCCVQCVGLRALQFDARHRIIIAAIFQTCEHCVDPPQIFARAPESKAESKLSTTPGCRSLRRRCASIGGAYPHPDYVLLLCPHIDLLSRLRFSLLIQNRARVRILNWRHDG